MMVIASDHLELSARLGFAPSRRRSPVATPGAPRSLGRLANAGADEAVAARS